MKGFIFFTCAIWIAIFFALAGLSTGAERGIGVKRINDLSHESGKLGEYKALIIGINDYKGAKIPDLETPINDATALAKGSLKNNFTFLHLSFRPSSAAAQSRSPRNSPLFLWLHSIAATKYERQFCELIFE